MFEKGDIVYSDHYGFMEIVTASGQELIAEVVQNGIPKQLAVKPSEIFRIARASERLDLIS